MKFRKSFIGILRRILGKGNFYDDIHFKGLIVKKHTKKLMEEWMHKLSDYKQIKIEKFRDLFKEMDEIAFPIQIINCYWEYSALDIEFLDRDGKEYYMYKRNFYDYHNIQNYVIGRRNSSLEPLVDREFYYNISEEGKDIVLMKTVAMKLKADGTNDNIKDD